MKNISKMSGWEQLIDCCLHKQNPFFNHFHEFILVFLIGLGITSCKQEKQKKKRTSEKRPNIVILFADDMGYGDPSCYGNATIRTPNIDSLASDGIRFTSFVTGVVSVPSRCQLMTGRYRQRVNFGGGTGSGGQGGLPESELTLAEGLKEAGYATGMLGKWHLGYAQKKYLPVNQGFDSWFGLPYSNDMRKPWVQTDVPLGIYEDTSMVEHPVNQNTLTTRYTKRARQFISSHAGKEKPFFLYLAYNMPHLPIHTTEKFRGNELQAMRKGEWKLREVDGKTQLFNLQEDPGERFNRASEKPESMLWERRCLNV